jgi:hypothetical protein
MGAAGDAHVHAKEWVIAERLTDRTDSIIHVCSSFPCTHTRLSRVRQLGCVENLPETATLSVQHAPGDVQLPQAVWQASELAAEQQQTSGATVVSDSIFNFHVSTLPQGSTKPGGVDTQQ